MRGNGTQRIEDGGRKMALWNDDMKQSTKPPRICEWLLSIILPIHAGMTAEGDYREIFARIVAKQGRICAIQWYIFQVFKSTLPFLRTSISWRMTMFNSYLIIALRNLKKHKLYAAINITGLAVGLAACILIFLWVHDEWSYDRFHEHARRIYRIHSEYATADGVFYSAGSPAPLGPAMRDELPEVEGFTRVQCGWSWPLYYGKKNLLEERFAAVEPSFFDIFDYSFIHGDARSALKEPRSIVLTESLAKKCFGDEDPMGRIMKIYEENYMVTGIIRDVQKNSHFHFHYMLPLTTVVEGRSGDLNDWKWDQAATYLLLKTGKRTRNIESKMAAVVSRHLPDARVRLHLQPLTRIHLHSTEYNNWMVDYPNKGNAASVWMLSTAAAGILLLACINFMSLSTARFDSRSKEIGLRKVVGARRIELIRQFLGESTLMTFIAFLAGLLLVSGFLPAYNRLTGKALTLSAMGKVEVLAGLAGIIGLTSLLAGFYPAVFLSSFRPAAVMKSVSALKNHGKGMFRKGFVVFQFAATITLMIFTLVVAGQMHYIQNHELGCDPSLLVSCQPSRQGYGAYDAFKNELLRNPDILAVTRAMSPFRVNARGTKRVDWEGKDPTTEVEFRGLAGGYDFQKVFGLTMAEGRFFDPELSDNQNSWVLNETAVRLMEMEHPIGRWFSLNGRRGRIIGVVMDFHAAPLHETIMPMAIRFFVLFPQYFIRVREGSMSQSLQFINMTWDKFEPEKPFQYELVRDNLEKWYDHERRVGTVFRYFTIVTILISGMGLVGLASFMAERRTKEIGVRKVLGASVMDIVVMLSGNLMKWVLLANCFAWPLAWILGFRWMQGFAYRFDMGIWIFLVSSLTAVVIALVSTGMKTWVTAKANPVDVLRYE